MLAAYFNNHPGATKVAGRFTPDNARGGRGDLTFGDDPFTGGIDLTIQAAGAEGAAFFRDVARQADRLADLIEELAVPS